MHVPLEVHCSSWCNSLLPFAAAHPHDPSIESPSPHTPIVMWMRMVCEGRKVVMMQYMFIMRILVRMMMRRTMIIQSDWKLLPLTTPRSPINLSRRIEGARSRGLCYPSAFLCQVFTKSLRRLSTEITSFLTFRGWSEVTATEFRDCEIGANLFCYFGKSQKLFKSWQNIYQSWRLL